MTKRNYLLTVLFATIMAMVVAVDTYAVPARPNTHRTLTLADGTTVTARLVGDEHGHWFVDQSGKTLAVKADGKAEYLDASQILEMKANREVKMKQSNARRANRMPMQKASFVQNPDNNNYKGQKKGIVILVNFADKKLATSHGQSYFDKRFNEEGYSQTNCVGSVHDYFYDQSYGTFDLTFDVVGPVTVSKNLEYYGENDDEGNDKHASDLTTEAVKLADSLVDFSKYDWDNDGYVDQVFIIYAGHGEAAGAAENTIWPHEWDLESAQYYGMGGNGPIKLDNVYVNTYAMTCEYAGASGSTIDGIGTACHEFSHCLGFPDFYDSAYNGGAGMMDWDMLCMGSYAGPTGTGEVPCGYTAYERWCAGWLTPTVLEKPCFVKDMPAVEKKPVAYKIINDANPNEYYMLDNRQPVKWDTYIGGHGMIISHIYYDQEIWEENTVNNVADKQRMTYFPADNSYGTYYKEYGQYAATTAQIAGDPFPGTSKNTSFTDNSTPAATLYTENKDGRKFMGKPITDIAEMNGLISFTFDGGITTPDSLSSSDVTESSFVASWGNVAGATSYEMKLISTSATITPQDCILIDEDHSGFKSVTSNSTDLSSSLDKFTKTNGWTGSKVYYDNSNNADMIKIGTSKVNGYLTTPQLQPENGAITVKVAAKQYNTDGTAFNINLISSGGTTLESQKVTLTKTVTDYVVNFSNIDQPVKVQLTPSSRRAYINTMCVYDGNYTADDLTASAKPQRTQAIVCDTMIVDIKETSYKLTDLKAEAYKWSVRSVCADGASEWSKWNKVVLLANVKKGDANGDGEVSVADLSLMASYVLGNPCEINLKNADMNDDGEITVSDISAVASLLLQGE